MAVDITTLPIVASLTPRNGAYLISLDHLEEFKDKPANELYDAARSVAVARRETKNYFKELGLRNLNWLEGPERGYPDGVLVLVGFIPPRVRASLSSAGE